MPSVVTSWKRVLAKLRVRRTSDREMVATVGRPGECWFPGDPPEEMHVSIVGAMAKSGQAGVNRTHTSSEECEPTCQETLYKPCQAILPIISCHGVD